MKSIQIFGVTAKNESSYNAGGALSIATDGVQLSELPELALSYAFDGARPSPPGTLGYLRRAAPNGRTGTITLKQQAKGAGIAYAASTLPTGHVLRLLSGWDATLTTTPGSEKVVYTPTPGPVTFASGVLNLYARGELYSLTGVYGEWTLSSDGPNIPTEEFALQGLVGAVSETGVPAIVYPYASVTPPKSVGAAMFTIGNLTNAIVRKWTTKMGREIGARMNQNAVGGHAGFFPGRRTCTLEVTIETPDFAASPYHGASTLDPYNLFDAATELAWSLKVGSVQYNRRTLAGPAAQLSAPPKPDADGSVALTTLTFQLNPSALGLNDEISDTWD